MLVINAFSANMLPNDGGPVKVDFTPLTLQEAAQLLADMGVVFSSVGHTETAVLFSALLGADVPCVRATIQLRRGDRPALLGQYRGPRLPEGATSLPEGATVEWWAILVY